MLGEAHNKRKVELEMLEMLQQMMNGIEGGAAALGTMGGGAAVKN